MKRNKVLIIAEAGVNHNGDLALAKRLIDVAVVAGVDLVKFQTFKAEDLVSKEAKQADYQKKNIGEGSDSQFEMLKRLELSEEDHLELVNYCEEKGIEFFSTAFDVKGLEYLNSLGFSRFKVPSGEITNYPYLKKISEFGKPVILSTGMADLVEIKAALLVLEEGIAKENITVLHCNTEYPTPMEDVNLKAMNTIAKECDVEVGYSDHTLGIEVPIAAVAMGAVVIEKHFTLDRSLPGPDHAASLEPDELKAMVQAIRNIEKAISGNGIKAPSKSELKNRTIARKSLHLINNLVPGHILVKEDLVALRPGDGISPMIINEVLGKEINQNLDKGAKLLKEHLK
ncbi:N-acetylneuraminate synthase [Algoriphagus lutimaris]|uniref:N-acetylneuraminate synthase n=1 Tax=Algoriphagus lutimaris TaxID=613197 RepID=UPI00196A65C8|nr:N-acetylneuraminate synthase [Algoriphagus lutimaris]MBN3518668.1 N-acetylneuraminate synthase [Algoriphagus lutimaris]